MQSLSDNINHVNQYNETPLSTACQSRTDDVKPVQKLLALKADVNLELDRERYTPTSIAVVQGNFAIFQLLLAAKADLNKTVKSTNTTLLHLAAIGEKLKGAKEIVNFLLEKKIFTVDVRNSKQVTALHDTASERNNPEMITCLIEHKADINIQSNNLQTALMYAAFNNWGTNISTLLAHAADPNISDSKGNTALMIALFEKNFSAAQSLVNFFCMKLKSLPNTNNPKTKISKPPQLKVHQCNAEGDTSLMVASLVGATEIVRALITLKADVNAKNKNNLSPIRRASSCFHRNVVNLLIEFKARAHDVEKDRRFMNVWSSKSLIPLLTPEKKSQHAVVKIISPSRKKTKKPPVTSSSPAKETKSTKTEDAQQLQYMLAHRQLSLNLETLLLKCKLLPDTISAIQSQWKIYQDLFTQLAKLKSSGSMQKYTLNNNKNLDDKTITLPKINEVDTHLQQIKKTGLELDKIFNLTSDSKNLQNSSVKMLAEVIQTLINKLTEIPSCFSLIIYNTNVKKATKLNISLETYHQTLFQSLNDINSNFKDISKAIEADIKDLRKKISLIELAKTNDAKEFKKERKKISAAATTVHHSIYNHNSVNSKSPEKKNPAKRQSIFSNAQTPSSYPQARQRPVLAPISLSQQTTVRSKPLYARSHAKITPGVAPSQSKAKQHLPRKKSVDEKLSQRIFDHVKDKKENRIHQATMPASDIYAKPKKLETSTPNPLSWEERLANYVPVFS